MTFAVKRINSSWLIIFFFVVPLLAAAGCSEEKPRITVESARAVVLEGNTGEARVYLKIKNEGGPDAVKAVKINVPGATSVVHIMTGNRMVRTELMRIGARETIEFRQDNVHIMIENLPKGAGNGYPITVTLVLERSGEMNIPLTLTAATKGAPGASDGHGVTVRD